MFLFLAAGGLDALVHNLWAVRHDVCLKRGAKKVPLLVLFPCLAGCSSHFFLAFVDLGWLVLGNPSMWLQLASLRC